MICTKCGKVNKLSAQFCRYCGSRIVDIEEGVFDKEKFTPAGFWIRLGAYIIDLIGILGCAVVLGFVMTILFGESITDLPNVFWSYASYVIYSTFTLSIWSTTLGKYIYGLKVINESENNIDFGTAVKRSLLQPLSTIFFGIGYWNMDKNINKQAWHDEKSRTIVVRRKKNLVLAYLLTIIMGVIWLILSAEST
ncbi:MAG: RDD family protein [Candidatus Collierbacteria bacterium GW2011_GWF2_44_15]|uniref:RDD family protein n=1 Tax=Candidatus Collierbacteria bacterium GW2011_GWF2_44_15 TaxID=1618404 RepID=A0A0G1KD11_9BACT|nr:MAG: RDD family protein [Candidatus Collierbacteria bacterium GW2011_GWF2_44_15]